MIEVMFTVIGFVAGGATALIGYASGRLSKRPHKLRPCSCRHGYGFHRDGGRCMWVPDGITYKQCSCQGFDGEVPADVYGRMIT